MSRRRWNELTPWQRRGFIVASVAQVTLAAAAWTDLARRPVARVNGREPVWASAIAVNFPGPTGCLCWGRAKDAS